jgi:hypothetical protein
MPPIFLGSGSPNLTPAFTKSDTLEEWSMYMSDSKPRQRRIIHELVLAAILLLLLILTIL